MVKTDTAVVIPAHNEADTIQEVIQHLQIMGFHMIFVVDDASSDSTKTLAEVCGAVVLSLPVQLGAWGALQTGIRYAQRHGFTRVVTLDADGQHDAQFMNALTAPLVSDIAQVTIGSHPERISQLRKIAWRYFRWLTRLTIQDITSGFRGYNANAMKALASPQVTLLDYQDVGVLIFLKQWRLNIQEVSVEIRGRQHGKSKIFSSWLVVAMYMLKSTMICVAKRHR